MIRGKKQRSSLDCGIKEAKHTPIGTTMQPLKCPNSAKELFLSTAGKENVLARLCLLLIELAADVAFYHLPLHQSV